MSFELYNSLSVELKTIVLYCKRNARFPVHGSPPRKFRKCAAAAPDEFVSEYSVPAIITQYQGLLLSTQGLSGFLFSFGLDWSNW